ncbi:hypothetical protein [Borrelia duttonii]|uniref:Uncharacterized conserved protein n=1 Tax=Borrelia duttonii (strain Ly) TaxID=412419 RepID=B5RN89_BORDL|nr:uncharacterized conserved protein [Borrelia duttonii Ly]
MRYVQTICIISVVVLIIPISCKLNNNKLKAESETKLAKENAKLVADSIVGQVSKLTGLATTEIKALSKEELAKIANEAKATSEISRKNIDDFHKIKGKAKLEVSDIPNFIKVIRESAEKISIAFRTLLSAGYNGPVANAVNSNINSGVKIISLLEQLLNITTKEIYNNKELEIRDAIEEFNRSYPGLRIYVIESRDKDPMKTYINVMMKNVSRYFFNGVHEELLENLDKAPNKLKEALTSLKDAANSISTAAGIIELCFSEQN